MAGLDHKESPFVSASQLPVTKGQSYSQQPKSSTPYNNTTTSRIQPPPAKPRTNGFLGDISSSNKVATSGFSGGTFSVQTAGGDPTMKGHFEGNYDTAEQAKRDELYERILQETSNAFHHNRTDAGHASGKPQGEIIQTENKNKQDTEDKAKEWSKKLGEEIVFDASEVDDSPKASRPVPLPRGRSSEEEGVNGHKPTDSGKPADTAGPGPREGSRMSDYNYSMDSFEQSYLSERGEVVRFDGDFDTYGSSPSPPPQVIESEENDF